MTQPAQHGGKIVLDRPGQRWRIWGYLIILAALASMGGAYWAWEVGDRHPPVARSETGAALELWEVDLGDVSEAIVENGTLESASNTVVRCQVEALIGMVGGSKSSGTSGTNRSGSGSGTSSSSGSSSASGQGSSSSSGSSGGSSTQAAVTTKASK